MRSFGQYLFFLFLIVTHSIAYSQSKPVKFITLDPGHFHAALVQKTMLAGLNPEVQIYAPAGEDLNQHLQKINSYNK